MGFLDKARAAATELAAKADEALNTAGVAGPAAAAKAVDRHFRDLGVLAYLQATGRPADESEHAQLIAAVVLPAAQAEKAGRPINPHRHA